MGRWDILRRVPIALYIRPGNRGALRAAGTFAILILGPRMGGWVAWCRGSLGGWMAGWVGGWVAWCRGSQAKDNDYFFEGEK